MALYQERCKILPLVLHWMFGSHNYTLLIRIVHEDHRFQNRDSETPIPPWVRASSAMELQFGGIWVLADHTCRNKRKQNVCVSLVHRVAFHACLLSCSERSRCRWHMHQTNHGYFDRSKILNIIQIMNVYDCNGTNIFMRWKIKCSIQRGEAELNGTFHLSPNKNICSIVRMRKHSLFISYNLYKDSNSWTN